MPLPASRAGKHFHDGMATGKFHGVIIPTTPTGIRVVHASFEPSSDGTVSPHGAAALAGDEAGHVDGLLHVAARLDADLAALPAHELGQLGLAGREHVAGGGDDLGPGRHRHPGPGPLGLGGGRDGAVDVVGAVARVAADDLGRAGRVGGLNVDWNVCSVMARRAVASVPMTLQGRRRERRAERRPLPRRAPGGRGRARPIRPGGVRHRRRAGRPLGHQRPHRRPGRPQARLTTATATCRRPPRPSSPLASPRRPSASGGPPATHDDPLGRAARRRGRQRRGDAAGCRPRRLRRGRAAARRPAAPRARAGRRRRAGHRRHLADQLGQLRDGVEVLDGTAATVAARVALAGRDRRGGRHRRAPLRHVGARRRWPPPRRRRRVVAVTDGPLSPARRPAPVAAFDVVAEGAGPFDSHVGTLALLHALVAGVADRLRASATGRLDRIEAAWRAAAALRELSARYRLADECAAHRDPARTARHGVLGRPPGVGVPGVAMLRRAVGRRRRRRGVAPCSPSPPRTCAGWAATSSPSSTTGRAGRRPR